MMKGLVCSSDSLKILNSLFSYAIIQCCQFDELVKCFLDCFAESPPSELLDSYRQ